jgi:hypothetical protein
LDGRVNPGFRWGNAWGNAAPLCLSASGKGDSIASIGPTAASLFAENNALFAARPAVLRQCHTGHSNARRDVIDSLTKLAPVLDFHDGW